MEIFVEAGIFFRGQPAGEANDRDALLFCAACDAERPFALKGLFIDAALACDHQLGTLKRFVESRYIQKIIYAVDQFGAQEPVKARSRAACCPARRKGRKVYPRLAVNDGDKPL